MNSKNGVDSQQNFRQCLMAELDALYRTASYMTGIPDIAEDIVQDVALKAIRGQNTFRPEANFRPWIFTILRHTVADYYRSQKIQHLEVNLDEMLEHVNGDHATSSMADLNQTSIEKFFLDQIWEEEISEALRELPEEMRLAVLLVDVEEFSYRDIAEVLGWSPGSVMSRIYRGRQKLRQRLVAYAADKGYKV